MCLHVYLFMSYHRFSGTARSNSSTDRIQLHIFFGGEGGFSTTILVFGDLKGNFCLKMSSILSFCRLYFYEKFCQLVIY